MILKTEFLKYGRSTWLPMLLIFYNALLAFFTILLLYFRTESYQGAFYYNTSPYLQQFLTVSSIQILITFLIVPVVFSWMYNMDRENHIQEQLSLIPGAIKRYLYSKCVVTVCVNMILYISSIPILSLSCIYSDVSFLKLIRVAAVSFLFSIWSVAITAFFHVTWSRSSGAVIATILTEILFCSGSIFVISMIGNYYTNVPGTGSVPLIMSYCCVILMFTNPMSAYMGYYGNLTGNIGVMSRLCGMIGIDSTQKLFRLLFYKGACVTLLLSAVILLLSTSRIIRYSCTNIRKHI